MAALSFDPTRPGTTSRATVLAAGLIAVAIAAASSAQVTVLPPPDESHDSLSGAALASDGARLIIHYCAHESWTNFDKGRIKEFSGGAWHLLNDSNKECDAPDVAVRGDHIIATGRSDSGNLTVWSNAFDYPKWIGRWDSPLQQHWDPRSAFGLGYPFSSFRQLCSGFGWSCAFITCYDCSVGWKGAYRWFDLYTSWSVGAVALAGNDSALYAAFASTAVGCINVNQLTFAASDWLGPCFHFAGKASWPEVTLLAGQPAVAFVEDNVSLWIALWDGQFWQAIGTATAPSGFSYRNVKLAGSGNRLWVAFELHGAPSSAWISRYENGVWTDLGNPLAGLGDTAYFTDLAVYQGVPHLTVFDNELKVLRIGGTASCTYALSGSSASVAASGGAGSVGVTAGGGCAWTATSGVPWISVTSGASGSGNGTVNYSVDANNGTARSGTLTIAGGTFTVHQPSRLPALRRHLKGKKVGP